MNDIQARLDHYGMRDLLPSVQKVMAKPRFFCNTCMRSFPKEELAKQPNGKMLCTLCEGDKEQRAELDKYRDDDFRESVDEYMDNHHYDNLIEKQEGR